jgi:hypothetical protein
VFRLIVVLFVCCVLLYNHCHRVKTHLQLINIILKWIKHAIINNRWNMKIVTWIDPIPLIIKSKTDLERVDNDEVRCNHLQWNFVAEQSESDGEWRPGSPTPACKLMVWLGGRDATRQHH